MKGANEKRLHTISDSNDTTRKIPNCRDSQKIDGCRRLGTGDEQVAPQDSEGSGTTLRDTALVDARHNALSKPMDCTTRRMNPTVNYGL